MGEMSVLLGEAVRDGASPSECQQYSLRAAEGSAFSRDRARRQMKLFLVSLKIRTIPIVWPPAHLLLIQARPTSAIITRAVVRG